MSFRTLTIVVSTRGQYESTDALNESYLSCISC